MTYNPQPNVRVFDPQEMIVCTDETGLAHSSQFAATRNLSGLTCGRPGCVSKHHVVLIDYHGAKSTS